MRPRLYCSVCGHRVRVAPDGTETLKFKGRPSRPHKHRAGKPYRLEPARDDPGFTGDHEWEWVARGMGAW